MGILTLSTWQILREKKLPDYVNVTVSQPIAAELEKDALPSKLVVNFSKQVAQLADVGKEVKGKISISPKTAGS